MNSKISSRGAEMKAWALTGITAAEILRSPAPDCARALRGALDDRERAVAHVHARGGDRRAFRLRDLPEAELADEAAALQLVHQLARQRHPVARRTARRVELGSTGLAAEHRGEVTSHGGRFR